MTERFCVELQDGGELWVHANEVQIRGGSLILARRRLDEDDEVAMALAPGAWTCLKSHLTPAEFERAADEKFCVAIGPPPPKRAEHHSDDDGSRGSEESDELLAAASSSRSRRWFPWKLLRTA